MRKAEASERRGLRELYRARVPEAERDGLKRGAEYLLERTLPDVDEGDECE